MGSALSKRKRSPEKVSAAGRQVDSAPARLDGGGVTESPEVSSTAAAAQQLSPSPQRRPASAESPAPSAPMLPFQEAPEAAQKENSRPSAPPLPQKYQETEGEEEDRPLSAAPALPEGAAILLNVYSETLVRGLFALMWGDREESLKAIIRKMDDSPFLNSVDRQTIWDVTTEVLARALKDKVVPVYFSALELLKALMSNIGPSVPVEALHAGLTKLLPSILARVGNNNSRIHTASLQALLLMAADRRLSTEFVGPYVLAPPKKKSGQTPLLAGRLELIQSLLKEFKSTRGMSIDAVMAFAQPALDSPDEKLRRNAVRVVCELYSLQRMAGGVLDEKYLVPLKPAVQRKLRVKFAEIDGVAPPAAALADSSGKRRRHELAPLKGVHRFSDDANDGGATAKSSVRKSANKKPERAKKQFHDESGVDSAALSSAPWNQLPPVPPARRFDALDEGLMNDILNQ